MKRKLLWLRELLARRKWIVWVAVALVVLAIAEVGVTLLLPKHDLNTLVQFEEKSNGIGELPNGGRETG